MSTHGPLPVIGGKRATWICGFCYALSIREKYPTEWGRVVRVACFMGLEYLDACPACIARMEEAGNYGFAAPGAYADGPDPRG